MKDQKLLRWKQGKERKEGGRKRENAITNNFSNLEGERTERA